VGSSTPEAIHAALRTARVVTASIPDSTMDSDAGAAPAGVGEESAGSPAQDDAVRLGRALRSALDAAGISGRRAVVALPREAVAIKRLSLPAADANELPDMVRLAMQRELPLDTGAASIDFVALGRDGGTTDVCAVAAPERMMNSARRTMEAAGLTIARVAPRCLGAVYGVDRTTEGSILVIDATASRLELSVVTDGKLGFSRGSELRGGGGESIEPVVTELRRTWMGHQVVGGEAVSRSLLMAPPAMAKRLAEVAREITEHEVIALPQSLSSHDGVATEHDDVGAWPLAALLVETASGSPMIDLASPRRAPDLAGRRRQLILAGAGLLAVTVLAGYSLGRREAEREQDRREELVDKARAAASEGRRMRRDEDKVAHLEQWMSARQDWIADLLHLKALLPEPGDVVVDSITGTLDWKGVKWTKEKGWSSGAGVRIVLEGEAKTRPIADAMRERLVKDGSFVVATSGSDSRGGNRLPYPFGLLMTSDRGVKPTDASKSTAPANGSAAPPTKGPTSGTGASAAKAPPAALSEGAPQDKDEDADPDAANEEDETAVTPSPPSPPSVATDSVSSSPRSAP